VLTDDASDDVRAATAHTEDASNDAAAVTAHVDGRPDAASRPAFQRPRPRPSHPLIF
jgi:hypothetical protein